MVDRCGQMERALIVSWLLMGQTLTRQEEVAAPKNALISRLDPTLPTAVRYVQLRHRSTAAEPADQGDGPGRTYHHRWIVTGHWRRASLPSQQRHRPVWIRDHWKGPEGAPVLDPGKLVHVLRR